MHIEILETEQQKKDFFKLVDRVNLLLMDDQEAFYSYFLFQMEKEICYTIPSPTGISFKNGSYVLALNPLLFSSLTLWQMATSIKHEIHHIISLHLTRAKALKNQYSPLALTTAMDLVVNMYLDHLPPYAVTLEHVNTKYKLSLKPYESFEYYVEALQDALNLLEEDDKEGEEDGTSSTLQMNYDQEKTHDTWEESDEIEEDVLFEITQKAIDKAKKGEMSPHLQRLLETFSQEKPALPWQLYLKKQLGRIEVGKKRTITRRNRRQPHRLDLRGSLTNHQAKIIVALDTSGSISEAQFQQAMQEVMHIIKHVPYHLSVIACDDEIREVYQVKTAKDLRKRPKTQGGTQFSPVFQYANTHQANLVIYFTDGQGERSLKVTPKGYKVLWLISNNHKKLSLKESYGRVKYLQPVKTKEALVEMNDVRLDGYSMNHQAPSL